MLLYQEHPRLHKPHRVEAYLVEESDAKEKEVEENERKRADESVIEHGEENEENEKNEPKKQKNITFIVDNNL